MAKAVRHDTSSAVVTTGWEIAKGGIGGWLATAVVGAVVTAALVAGGAAVLGAVGGAITAGSLAGVLGSAAAGAGAAASAMFTTLGGAITTGLVSLAGGLMTASSVGTIGAAIGGIVGLLHGGSRVSNERQRYNEKMAARSHAAAARVEYAHQVGAQEGYMAGVQDGQQMVVNKLREMQYAAIQEQMGQAQAKANTPCGTPKCSHAEAEMKRRQAAAATGQQIG